MQQTEGKGQLIPVSEAATMLGFSRRFVYTLIKEGLLPVVLFRRPGAKKPAIRVRRSDVQARIDAAAPLNGNQPA